MGKYGTPSKLELVPLPDLITVRADRLHKLERLEKVLSVTVCIHDPNNDLDLLEIFQSFEPTTVPGYSFIFVTIDRAQIFDLLEVAPHTQGLFSQCPDVKALIKRNTGVDYDWKLNLSAQKYWYPVNVSN